MFRPFPLLDQIPVKLKPYIMDFHWNMDRLHALDLPIETLPIRQLTWQLDLPWWQHGGRVFSLTPNEVRADSEKFGEQYQRTMATDLQYPLIVRKVDGRIVVMDGVHRLLKAVIQDRREMTVQFFDDKLIPEVALPSWKVGTVQARDIQGDTASALRVIDEAMDSADRDDVDILCFPECFLQGYTLDDKETKERALDLMSPQFNKILRTLANHKVAIILGMIEKDASGYYNTAAVIQSGKLLGTYRKVHLFERNFQPGEAYPVFTVNGLTLGINICYDARFTEGPAALATQGAKVIFYPLNNRLPHEKATNSRDKHIPNLVARAKESGCWVVSSDVIAHNDTHTGYGCTAIVDPKGEVVSRVEELEAGTAIIELH